MNTTDQTPTVYESARQWQSTDPVVQLLLTNGGRIDQRHSWQTSRDEALAALHASGAVRAAQDAGLVEQVGAQVINLTPKVGMPATVYGYSDTHPYEVIAVSASGARVTLRALNAEADPNWKRDFTPGGFCGHTYNDGERKYAYTSDPKNPPLTASRCKDGSYKTNQGPVRFGNARKYYDSNF